MADNNKRKKGRNLAVDALFKTNFSDDIDHKEILETIRLRLENTSISSKPQKQFRMSKKSRTTVAAKEKRGFKPQKKQKKSSFSFILSLAASLAIIAGAVLFIGKDKFFPAKVPVIARILSDDFDVTVKRNGRKILCKSGMELCSKDVLHISKKADIIYPDKTKITCYNNTYLMLAKTLKGGKNIQLTKGTIDADVTRQMKGMMLIKTPQAIVTVIGTRFTVKVDDKQTQVKVDKGKVKVKEIGTSQSTLLTKGKSVTYGIKKQQVNIDVTDKVIVLGKPFRKSAYANNIWDMIVFGNRIYFGHGDAHSKAGPIPMISFDLKNNCFSVGKFLADDEQIDVFRVIGGKLFAPGLGARGASDYGNFYRLKSEDKWEKISNIPNTTMVYDLYAKDGQLFAGLGSTSYGICVSDNSGKNWKRCPSSGMNLSQPRFCFLEVGNTLFNISETIWTSNTSLLKKFMKGRILAYDESFYKWVERPDLTHLMLFPGSAPVETKMNQAYPGRVARPIMFKGKTLYIGTAPITATRWLPFGLYCVTSFEKNNVQSQNAKLPGKKSSKPWDILVRDQIAYVLISEKIEKEGQPDIIRVRVAKSSDGTNWETLFFLDQPTFARSFEEHNGDFYLGLGTDEKPSPKQNSYSYTDGIKNESGTVLKVPREAYSN